jgi:hypothetical protein
VAQELFLALIVGMGLHHLLRAAFRITHDDLHLAELADTRHLAAVIAVKMGNDDVRQRLEAQPKIAQLPLQGRKGLRGVDPGIDQDEPLIRFH